MTLADRVYAAAAPPAFGLVWSVACATGASPDEQHARRGVLPPAGAPLLWFHGASAGEMAAAAKLAGLLRHNGYAFSAGYTAANRAGVEFIMRAGAHPPTNVHPGGSGAQQGVLDGDVATLAPWDTPRWVGRAFDRWRPAALFLIETELWPRLVFDAWRRGVPVFCVSARVYPRDVCRYRAIRTWIAPMLRRLAAVLAQNESERDRFIRLGAGPERCVVAGNLKHLPDDPVPDAGLATRKSLGVAPDERVVVFGSVHADETGVVATVLHRLDASGVRVIVAPRHAWNASRLVVGLQRCGARVWRRTSGVPPPRWRVLVLDTVGELRQAYAMSTVAVVGGGFGRHGGQNPMEPVRAGVPVIFGPHGAHFADEFRALAAVIPEARVASTAELSARLHEWLGDEEHRRRIAFAQRESLPDGVAVAKRYLAILSPWLQHCGISVQG